MRMGCGDGVRFFFFFADPLDITIFDCHSCPRRVAISSKIAYNVISFNWERDALRRREAG